MGEVGFSADKNDPLPALSHARSPSHAGTGLNSRTQERLQGTVALAIRQADYLADALKKGEV